MADMKTNPLVTMSMDELAQMHPCTEAMLFVRKHKTLHAAWQKCERADWMIWFLRRKSLLEKPIAVRFACQCAERVLPIFESKCPDDKRPRRAIEAALKWLNDPSEASRNAANAAADAAAAANAYAANAAANAYAADAAATAANAAANAAADAAAAAAANAAAAAARNSERKWQANQLRRLVRNPFRKSL
jgi:hypothetical protein